MLASLYHPDNAETGNSEKFIRLSAAHQILSDPEKRARYDVRYREAVRLRGKIFDPAAASNSLDFLRKHTEISTEMESVPWHVHKDVTGP